MDAISLRNPKILFCIIPKIPMLRGTEIQLRTKCQCMCKSSYLSQILILIHESVNGQRSNIDKSSGSHQ